MEEIFIYVIETGILARSAHSEQQARHLAEFYPHQYIYFFAEK